MGSHEERQCRRCDSAERAFPPEQFGNPRAAGGLDPPDLRDKPRRHAPPVALTRCETLRDASLEARGTLRIRGTLGSAMSQQIGGYLREARADHHFFGSETSEPPVPTAFRPTGPEPESN